MFPLFETILIENGLPANLYWHQKRVNESLAAMGFVNHGVLLKDIIKIPDWLSPENQYRCRVYYNQTKSEISFSEYQPKLIKTLKLVYIETISYQFKFTDRNQIDQLIELKENADDILIIKKGFITDTSMANIIFFDGKQWITPSTPLLEGTARNRLTDTGQIVKKPVTASDLDGFEGWNIINALRRFDPAAMFPIKSILK